MVEENNKSAENKKLIFTWFLSSFIGSGVGFFLSIFISTRYWIDYKWENGIFKAIGPFGFEVIYQSVFYVFLVIVLSIFIGLVISFSLSISQWIFHSREVRYINLLLPTMFSAIFTSVICAIYQLILDSSIEIFNIEAKIIDYIPILAIFSFARMSIGVNPLTFSIIYGIVLNQYSKRNGFENKQFLFPSILGIITGMVLPIILYLILLMPNFCFGPEC